MKEVVDSSLIPHPSSLIPPAVQPMPRPNPLRLLLSLLLAGALAAGCGGPTPPPEPTPPGGATPTPTPDEKIRLGAFMSLTGDTGQYGISASNGVTLAVEEINS